MNDNHAVERAGGLLRFERPDGLGPVWINPLQVFSVTSSTMQRCIVTSADRHEIVAQPAENVAAAIGAELEPVAISGGDPVPGV